MKLPRFVDPIRPKARVTPAIRKAPGASSVSIRCTWPTDDASREEVKQDGQV